MLRGRSTLESVSATNLDKIIMAVSTTVKESEWSPQQVALRSAPAPCSACPCLRTRSARRRSWGSVGRARAKQVGHHDDGCASQWPRGDAAAVAGQPRGGRDGDAVARGDERHRHVEGADGLLMALRCILDQAMRHRAPRLVGR